MQAASTIMGIAHNLPERIVTNFDLMKMMDTSDEFIVSRTGVRQRRYADTHVSASDLALPACRAAVADAGLQMNQIDLLIMSTITPDHADPGCAFFLQEKLHLTPIPVLDLNQQCVGLIYALSIADHFIRAGTYTYVLIACSEILSKRIDGSYDGRNLAILLGDGAAAAVIGPANDPDTGILSTILHANGAGAKALYTAAPGSASGKMCTITKDDIDAGRIHFRMDGKTVFDNGVACMSSVIQECLRANHLTIHDIDLLIPHQANLRMLETLAEKLALPPEKLFVNIQEYGNTGSASLPIALDQARKQQRAKPGDLVMLVGFGSGFAWASALIRL